MDGVIGILNPEIVLEGDFALRLTCRWLLSALPGRDQILFRRLVSQPVFRTVSQQSDFLWHDQLNIAEFRSVRFEDLSDVSEKEKNRIKSWIQQGGRYNKQKREQEHV